MKKIFLLLAAVGMIFTACTPGGGFDNDNNGNPTEQPGGGNQGGEDIPADAYIGLNKDVVTISPDGGSVDVTVYSNYKWTLSTSCDWCTASMSGGEANDDGVVVTLSADVAYDDRETTFIFSCVNAKKVLIVSQKFKETIIADENNTFNVPAEGGVVEIAYQTTVECEVVIPQNAQSWISITPKTRALVSEKATLTVAENTTYSDREAVVKVVKVGDNTLFAEYTISQVQNDAVIAENNTLNVGGWEQNATIQYQTNVECEVVIPDDCKEWISVVPETRALSRNSVTLNFADNNTRAERKGVVQVVAVNNKELVAEYCITQNQRYFMEYTTDNDNTIKPELPDIVANRYENGVGYIDFSKSITSIGNNAFKSCTSLTSITIPDSVTEIGSEAFSGCTSLTSITIPDSVTSIGANAFSGCTGELIINSKIIETDYNYNYYPSCEGNWLYGSNFTKLTIGNNITKIGSYAFYNCTSLTSITIPDSVTEIGGSAFFGCKGTLVVESKIMEIHCTASDNASTSARHWLYGSEFTDITIGGKCSQIGKYTFKGYTSLVNVTICDSIGAIRASAFSGCTKLENIIIPNSVTRIWSHAFYGCKNLKNISLPINITEIEDHVFYNCSSLQSIIIPDSVTSIGDYAFYGCTDLTSITIPDSVTSIGTYAFSGCTSLTSITIPNSVTTIGSDAFSGCTSLPVIDDIRYADTYLVEAVDKTRTSYTIKPGTRFIGNKAFEDCTSLTSITIPNSVTSIGTYAFYECTALTSITIPNSVTSIGTYAFYECTALTSVTIPNSVNEIGKEAFKGCTGELIVNCNIQSALSSRTGAFYGSKFTKVTIGNSVTSVGHYAFSGCTSLTSVTIPDSVTSIGGSAFRGCSSLTSITIPDSVTSIGDSAFSYCTSLTSVYCKPTTPPAGDFDMFYNNASGRKIYVPRNSVEAYKTSEYWSKYADYIVGYDF